MGVLLGLYRDNGQENGSYCTGIYRDDFSTTKPRDLSLVDRSVQAASSTTNLRAQACVERP